MLALRPADRPPPLRAPPGIGLAVLGLVPAHPRPPARESQAAGEGRRYRREVAALGTSDRRAYRTWPPVTAVAAGSSECGRAARAATAAPSGCPRSARHNLHYVAFPPAPPASAWEGSPSPPVPARPKTTSSGGGLRPRIGRVAFGRLRPHRCAAGPPLRPRGAPSAVAKKRSRRARRRQGPPRRYAPLRPLRGALRAALTAAVRGTSAAVRRRRTGLARAPGWPAPPPRPAGPRERLQEPFPGTGEG